MEDSTVAGSGKEANASSAKPALAQSCSVGMSLQKKPSLRRLGSLVSDEKRSKGSVKLQVYSQYFSSWGPLFILPVLALLAAGTERGLQQVQNWWLSVSADAAQGCAGLPPCAC